MLDGTHVRVHVSDIRMYRDLDLAFVIYTLDFRSETRILVRYLMACMWSSDWWQNKNICGIWPLRVEDIGSCSSVKEKSGISNTPMAIKSMG